MINVLHYQILVCTAHGKTKKSHQEDIIIINSSYQNQHAMANLSHLIDTILSLIYKMILSISPNNMNLLEITQQSKPISTELG